MYTKLIYSRIQSDWNSLKTDTFLEPTPYNIKLILDKIDALVQCVVVTFGYLASKSLPKHTLIGSKSTIRKGNMGLLFFSKNGKVNLNFRYRELLAPQSTAGSIMH